MLMKSRPLFIDISSHQTFLELSRSVAGKVLGVIMRAVVGLNKDVDFVTFDNYYNWNELYRGSYHALWPMYSVPTQTDKWMEVDLRGTTHMLDAEMHNNMAPEDVAYAIVTESNLVLERTGKRPWIYGAYYFLMKNLVPFVTEEWLNEHWFVLAQYNDGDAIEDEVSIILPDKIHIDKVAFQQTTGVAELYPGSGNVDRMRFLLGDVEELVDFMVEWEETNNGGDITSPVGCCEELSAKFDNFINGYGEDYQELNKDLSTLESDIVNVNARLDNKATKTKLAELSDKVTYGFLDTDGEIEKLNTLTELNLELNKTFDSDIQKNTEDIVVIGDNVQLGFGHIAEEIEELSKRVAVLQQRQLELAENGLEYEDTFKELDSDMETFSVMASINKVAIEEAFTDITTQTQEIENMAYIQRNNGNDIERIADYLDTHSHIEPVGGTFGQRIKWIFTGKTSV